MAARKSSLRDLAAKSRKDRSEAANTGPVAGRIAHLDPDLVHTGGLADRLDVSQAEIKTLAGSLPNAGQKVPILVRPHPWKPGEYEIVAGRRRLAACRLAGINVRAEIQDLDDTALVMSQAIENISREDLTYIERTKLAARMVDEAGLDEKDIDTAFSCGKTDRSRYLKIGRGVPDDILSFVGKAPVIGRPRWEKLVAKMAADETALPRMREALAAANTEDGNPTPSDARFSHLFDAAFRSDAPTSRNKTTAPAAREIRIPAHDKPIGMFKRTGTGEQLTLRYAPKPGFLDRLDRNVEAVIKQAVRDFEREATLDEMAEWFEADDKAKT